MPILLGVEMRGNVAGIKVLDLAATSYEREDTKGK